MALTMLHAGENLGAGLRFPVVYMVLGIGGERPFRMVMFR